jgi:hypothetical protein
VVDTIESDNPLKISYSSTTSFIYISTNRTVDFKKKNYIAEKFKLYTMKQLKDLIQKYKGIGSLKDEFLYRSDDGQTFKSIDSAFKAGVPVRIVKMSDLVVNDLRLIGLDNASEVEDLIKILSFSISKPSADKRGRVTYTDEEKKKIVEDWKEYEKDGGSKNQFIKENEMAYTTLLKWIKEFG